MSETPEQASRTVIHPQLGPGRLLKTYMGGYEWEVAFESGRRFRLPAREFAADSFNAWQTQAANIAVLSDAARNSYLAISHRRLFIKALVTEWYRQKEEGERVVDGEYAAAAIRGQSEALMELADSRQSPY